MKVGDLVRHPLSGDIGIIIDTTDESSSSITTYYSVAFPNGEFLIPQEHLEIIGQSVKNCPLKQKKKLDKQFITGYTIV